MGAIQTSVRERLCAMADEKYREFHSGLVPGKERILGVRLPNMRKLAKEFAKEDARSFLKEYQENVDPKELFYEEQMLEGLVIGYAKLELGERFGYLRSFVPKIDNWGVCDCSCATYKFMEQAREESWEFLMGYLKSRAEFEIRFALVSMLDHFITEEYKDRIFQAVESVHHDGYYVKMAAAWLVSVLYVKFPNETEAFLQKNTLDDFTHNKSIQKIRESYRVSKEDKERLNMMKRGRKA